MTFIQPSKHTGIENLIIAMLVLALIAGTFWIVIGYNQTVDLNHDITSAKAQLDSIGARNTVLNNQVIATLGGSNISALAAQYNLVEEKKPQYFPIDQKWPIASQQ